MRLVLISFLSQDIREALATDRIRSLADRYYQAFLIDPKLEESGSLVRRVLAESAADLLGVGS